MAVNSGDTYLIQNKIRGNKYCVPGMTGSLTIEYAVLTAIVVAAVIGMSVYTKRALSGKWREVGDVFGQGRQYEPGVTRHD